MRWKKVHWQAARKWMKYSTFAAARYHACELGSTNAIVIPEKKRRRMAFT
jgi:hypothetical protein